MKRAQARLIESPAMLIRVIRLSFRRILMDYFSLLRAIE